MLVLTRKVGESVYIDLGAALVTVDEIDNQSALVTFRGFGGAYRLAMRLNDCVDILKNHGGRLCTVMLTRVEPGRVRLGFDAPPRVEIDREEIFHLKNETRWSPTNGSDESPQRGNWRKRVGSPDDGTVRSTGEARAAV